MNPTRELHQRILRLRPDWDPSLLSGLIYLEGGYSNDNYRFDYGGERFVLRAPYRSRSYVDRRQEQNLYERGAAAGMPEVVAFDPPTGDMISRWVRGPMLADCDPDGPALLAYLSRLHRHVPPVDRVYDPVAQAREDLARAEAPGWVEALATRLTWHPDQLTTCHNDLNPWNVICRNDGPWITLDWEWVGRNDPLFDLVTLHQGAGLPGATLAELAAELLGRAPEQDRLVRCLTAFWLRETAWAMAEAAAGNGRREVIEQRELGLVRLRAISEGGG